MTTTNDEPEIRVEGSKLSTNQEPDVPVAFASVLDSDRPPATAPTTSSGYAAAAASYPTTSTPSMFQGYEPEATPVATAIPTKKPSDNAAHNNNISSTTTSNDNNNTTSSSSAFIPPPAPVVGVGNGAIPPGAPPGGLWVICKYTGNNTWCIIGSTGCFLFWCWRRPFVFPKSYGTLRVELQCLSRCSSHC